MELAYLLAFNIALIAAIASPGPSLLFMIKSSLSGGRRTGIATGLGLATMAALWTLMALLGLHSIFTLFPWAYLGLKTLGAAYLIWLAIGVWRGANAPVTPGPNTTTRTGLRAYLSGILVNLANPKSVFFSAAVLVVIFPPTLTTLDKVIILINHLSVEVIAQTTFAILLSTPAVSRRYLAAKPTLDRLTATILGLLGLRLLFSR